MKTTNVERLTLLALLLLLIAGAVILLTGTPAHATAIQSDPMGDFGGSVSEYCGSYEAAYGKTQVMNGPSYGTRSYTCEHVHGFTSDIVIQGTAEGHSTPTLWWVNEGIGLPYELDAYAWVPS